MIPILIILVIYILMVFSVKYRTAISILGIGTLLVYTTLFEGYTFVDAFKSFPLEIVLLILALALFSKIFENNGFLEAIGNKLLKLSKGSKTFIIIVLPLVMYVTSLFMNNLSVILIFTFIVLTIVRQFKFPVTPILVACLIASNIGGCPLPWADTPAVIITLYSDFTLFDFLNKLFIPCAIFEGLLILYLFLWYKYSNKIKLFKSKHSKKNKEKEKSLILKATPLAPLPPLPKDETAPTPPPPHEPPPHIKAIIPTSKFKRLYWPLIVFGVFIASVCIAPFINVSISYVCMFFIGFTLIFVSNNPGDILNSLDVTDSLVFISSLFMISGVLEHYGVLKTAVNYLLSFTGDNKILILLCILFCSFIIATFLSAGPAAATILPMCAQLVPIIGSNFVFIPLALGILAGSSMLPWSATGGPIMLSEVNRYLYHRKVSKEEKNNIMNIYDLKEYSTFSIPFSLIILLGSAIYISIYMAL